MLRRESDEVNLCLAREEPAKSEGVAKYFGARDEIDWGHLTEQKCVADVRVRFSKVAD